MKFPFADWHFQLFYYETEEAKCTIKSDRKVLRRFFCNIMYSCNSLCARKEWYLRGICATEHERRPKVLDYIM